MRQLRMMVLGIVGMLMLAFVMFVPMNAQAAKVAKNESVTLQNQGKQFYRFTLADDALVQINWSRNAKKTAHIRIYTDVNKNYTVYYEDINTSSGKDHIVLSEGVYYVDMYDTYATPTTIIRFDWTFASEYDKGNYSMKKAATLKKDTLVEVVQVNQYNYFRWYKITLTQEQKITILSPYDDVGAPFIYVPGTNEYAYYLMYNGYYDYDFSSDGRSKTSRTVYPAGTYYIVVPMYSMGPEGGYLQFKWR